MGKWHRQHDNIEPRATDDTAPEQVAESTATATPARALRVASRSLASLCLTVVVAHILMVFFYVAPSNPISQHYQSEIRAYIYPVFEQNWALFAPNPESSNTQVFARTTWMTESGDGRISDWFDISAVDRDGVKNQPIPSKVSQNILRRSLSAYLASLGKSKTPPDEASRAREKYLRNIAVQRYAAHDPQPFQAIQLMFVVHYVAPPTISNQTPADAPTPYTGIFPWWDVTPDGS